MTTLMPKQAGEEALTQLLRQSVSQLRGNRPEITDIQRSRSPYSSFYGSDIIRIRLSTGETFEFFLKDFGSYEDPKDGMGGRRDRELSVYRDLLAEGNLGTARYYGSSWAAEEGRFWLLLEFVKGALLRHTPFEYWILAAAWLGRLQGYFARNSSRFLACDALIRHDSGYFWSKAEPAVREVSQISVSMAARVERVLDRYGEPVQVMANQPVTFVHGSFTPTQILFDAEDMRICPIDWELAGLGSPLYDLAILSDGFEPSKLNQVWDAYSGEAARYGISVPGREEMKRVVDCFRLHRVINWLSKCVRKRYSEKSIVKLVNMCAQLGSLVC
jgi:hypothetical protein